MDEDRDFRRTNWMANTSVVLGFVCLLLQPLGCCFTIVATLPVMLLTLMAAALAWMGRRQALQHNRQGEEAAVLGMVLALINLIVGLGWALLWTCYGGVVSLVMLAN